jgi:dissimilatory sulfite reductase (desulfoviridin) alpha/beta subunit
LANVTLMLLKTASMGYKVYMGGMWGKRVAHGIPIRKIFTSKEEALDVVEKAILLYREQGKTGERFAQTIERIGFENVEAQLLSNDFLTESRKFWKQASS